MSTMQPGTFGTLPSDPYEVEQRTSVMAILSLVLSLICFVPGFGLLGALLGVVAIILISGAKGRLAGRGLAVGGIILGLLFTMLWVGIGIGGVKLGQFVNSMVVSPTNTALTAIEAGDFDKAKTSFASPTLEQITEADFIAFRTAYQADLGSFKSTPTGTWDWIKKMGEAGQMMQRFQGGNQNLIPVPATFEKGLGVFAVQISQNGPKPNPNAPGQLTLPITNLELITPSGKSIILFDPSNRPLPTPGTPPASSPTDPSSPTEPPVPATKPPAAG